MPMMLAVHLHSKHQEVHTLAFTKALLRTKKSNMSPPAAYSMLMPRYRFVRNTSRNCGPHSVIRLGT